MFFSKTWSIIKGFWKFFVETAKILAPFATLASLIIAFNSFKFAKQTKLEGAETTRRTVILIDSMKIATTEILSNLKSIPAVSESFKKGLDKMTGSIGSLETNLNAFSSTLQNYDRVLKTVAEATQKNVDVIQKQQKIWEAELNKVPKLELQLERAFMDSLGKVHIQAQIANLGNAAVKDFYLIIYCPKSYNTISQVRSWDTSTTVQSFSFTFNQLLGPAESETDFDKLKDDRLGFIVDKLSSKDLQYSFYYTIAYEKGRDKGYLKIKSENIQGYKK